MKDRKLRESILSREKKSGFDVLSPEELRNMEAYCDGYKKYLNAGKTEREAAAEAVRLAEEAGFTPWERGHDYRPGEKFYYVDREKRVFLTVMGKKSLAEGINLTAAHIDAPRIDLKATPLYEAGEMAFFKTQHYGGIRRYQWMNLPLAFHGVVVRQDGTKIPVTIGEDPDDPQFVICDLVSAMAGKQQEVSLADAFPSESMNILLGHRPMADDDGADRVKMEVLRLLYERYGIEEEDFISAEIEVVPALNARDVGFDRSFIGGYGQDDRVCAYAILKATLELGKPDRTAVCLLEDKEEVGSTGVTGSQSESLEWFLNSLCKVQNVDLYDCFAKSFFLSTDVTGGYDPHNAALRDASCITRCGCGTAISKNVARAGASGTTDASAEVMDFVRESFNEGGVLWQIRSPKDAMKGAGGTLSKFIATRNIETIDVGVPILSMHSPFEITSKIDCYMTYKGTKAIYKR